MPGQNDLAGSNSLKEEFTGLLAGVEDKQPRGAGRGHAAQGATRGGGLGCSLKAGQQQFTLHTKEWSRDTYHLIQAS